MNKLGLSPDELKEFEEMLIERAIQTENIDLLSSIAHRAGLVELSGNLSEIKNNSVKELLNDIEA